MNTTARKRHDPRRDATRLALIEAAESLFAEAGVDAVSTRQIGAAVGSLNTNVVAYHFGSKVALIEAVYRYRLPEIDRRRGELLAAAGEAASLPDLLRVFALPLYEQVDSAGQHSFARFLAGLERSGLIATRALVSADFPHSNAVHGRIAALLSMASEQEAGLRMRLVVSLIVAALQMIDREAASPAAAARLFDNTLAMAAAAMAAPAPEGIA